MAKVKPDGHIWALEFNRYIYIPRTEGSGDVMVLRQSRPPPAMVLTR